MLGSVLESIMSFFGWEPLDKEDSLVVVDIEERAIRVCKPLIELGDIVCERTQNLHELVPTLRVLEGIRHSVRES